ncbi:MAG TPA: hypothetical protein VNF74_06620 [Terriglobales bacterium]|nr:hypothetical protein [Terriglobales bacterium]
MSRVPLEASNRFLQHYIGDFNRSFAVPAAEAGTAFLPLAGQNLDEVFSLQHERTVNRDNTVTVGNLVLQIKPVRWRHSLAGCKVLVRQHLSGEFSLAYGPHCLGRFSAQGQPLRPGPAVEKPHGGKSPQNGFSTPLGNPVQNAGFPLSHRR